MSELKDLGWPAAVIVISIAVAAAWVITTFLKAMARKYDK